MPGRHLPSIDAYVLRDNCANFELTGASTDTLPVRFYSDFVGPPNDSLHLCRLRLKAGGDTEDIEKASTNRGMTQSANEVVINNNKL